MDVLCAGEMISENQRQTLCSGLTSDRDAKLEMCSDVVARCSGI